MNAVDHSATTQAQVDALHDTEFVVIEVSLNSPASLQSKRGALFSMPGVGTATEGFNALSSGANAIEVFSGELRGRPVVKAWPAAFPVAARIFSVGGIGIEKRLEFERAGVNGAGIGSSFYYPGALLEELTRRVRSLMNFWFEIQVSLSPTKELRR